MVVAYEGVPRTRAQTYAVVRHTQTADTVLVAHEGANLLAPSHVPNLFAEQSVSKKRHHWLVDLPCIQSRHSQQTATARIPRWQPK